MSNLGDNYTVRDKGATVRFKNPGMGTISANFRLSLDVIEKIRAEADATGKSEPSLRVDIVDESGKVVAEVEKVLSVRRRDRPAPDAPKSSSE